MVRDHSRRRILGLFAALGGAALVGCERAPAAATGENSGPAKAFSRGGDGKVILVYRDPECGCRESWAEIARGAGYQITIEDRADIAEVKARLGVPGQLASCHTAIIEGYAIEGHVPMRHIAKLVGEMPRDIRGLAVPGMPRGSPGMEMPDGTIDAFEVMAFDAAGKYSMFQA